MQFSEEQQIAYDIFNSGENMFLTGPGGTGKSAFIRFIQDESIRKRKDIQVCALTGCAALMLECKAKTIHSWAGIGLCTDSIEKIITRISRNRHAKSMWKTVDILVIDEVSMMSQKVFDTLDAIGKYVRRNHCIFGGIQLLFTGDFYQLPPISKNTNTETILEDNNSSASKFCFQSPIWMQAFPWKNHITLIKNYRQTDLVYQKILNQIRKGILKQSSYEILMEQIGKEIPSSFKPTKLYPTRNTANIVNNSEMSNLQTENIQFSIKNRYDLEMSPAERILQMPFNREQMDKELLYLQKNLLCVPVLNLKVGAQVMCLVNIKLSNGDLICNGSQGVVVRFTNKMEGTNNASLPVVLFNHNNYEMTMDYHVWPSENIPGIGVTQIPLIHAWAITIHKSQGRTLDMAEIDAGSGIFECGQTYVALSRVRSLDGLFLSAFDPSKIRVNGLVREFYEKLDYQTKLSKTQQASANSDKVVENKNNTQR